MTRPLNHAGARKRQPAGSAILARPAYSSARCAAGPVLIGTRPRNASPRAILFPRPASSGRHDGCRSIPSGDAGSAKMSVGCNPAQAGRPMGGCIRAKSSHAVTHSNPLVIRCVSSLRHRIERRPVEHRRTPSRVLPAIYSQRGA